uniref:Ribosomal protein S4 n=1 Tax=Prasinoderma coloniale TaxID=156133 RepID=V9PAE0_9VIRI|nr:ribosomal protein S4 [Prasinoderma coloniale]AGW52227.1 ribosomal protein S4 [Prasinoderma coloniale]
MNITRADLLLERSDEVSLEQVVAKRFLWGGLFARVHSSRALSSDWTQKPILLFPFFSSRELHSNKYFFLLCMTLPYPRLRTLRSRPAPVFHTKKLSAKLARLIEGGRLGLQGRSSRKLSWYKERLQARQNVRAFYGWMPATHFGRLMKKARSNQATAGPLFLQSLERMAFMVVYRAGFASTPRAARTQVRQGWYTLNGKPLSAATRMLALGDTLLLRARYLSVAHTQLQKTKYTQTHQWKEEDLQNQYGLQTSLLGQAESTKDLAGLVWRLRALSLQKSQGLTATKKASFRRLHLEVGLHHTRVLKADTNPLHESWERVKNQSSFPSLPENPQRWVPEKVLPGRYMAGHIETNPRLFMLTLISPPAHLVYPMKVNERTLDRLYHS